MRWRLAGALGLGVLLAAGSASAGGATTPLRYDGHRVLRVEPTGPAQLRRLLALADDVWTERPGLGAPVDVRVSAATQAQLLAEGFVFEVRIPDVQQAVDAERARLATPLDPAAASDWFSEFRDWNAINDYMDTLAALRPDLVSIEPVGTSLEGREIRALRLQSPATTGKAAMLLTGTMHAREWLSPMTVMCIAEAMVQGYEADPATTELLDALELVIVPVINPDGYVYSWTSERYWRKNRRDGHGVDLNRNWSYAWGGQGASDNPFEENYRGAGPLSEPETTALAAFIGANEHLVAQIDFHSYSELVLYPWGHQYGAAPDEAMLSGLAGQMAGAIGATHGHAYAPIQGSDLYPASGVVDDWSYGEHGMMAFTIELRGNDFVIPPSEIVPTCEENLEATLVLAQWAREQGDPVPVPEDDGDGTTTGAGSGDDDAGDDPPPPGGTGGGDDDGSTSGDDEDSGARWSDSGQDGALPPGFGDDDEAGGCGCHQPGPGARGWWVLLMGLGLGRRRRR